MEKEKINPSWKVVDGSNNSVECRLSSLFFSGPYEELTATHQLARHSTPSAQGRAKIKVKKRGKDCFAFFPLEFTCQNGSCCCITTSSPHFLPRKNSPNRPDCCALLSIQREIITPYHHDFPINIAAHKCSQCSGWSTLRLDQVEKEKNITKLHTWGVDLWPWKALKTSRLSLSCCLVFLHKRMDYGWCYSAEGKWNI